MAYAWSQRGIAFMVSSCGTTVQHAKAYKSKFEDEFGNVSEKELPRPAVAHFLYEFLPLIDEHNKARQNFLALEKTWLTKDCWVRLLSTFLGMYNREIILFMLSILTESILSSSNNSGMGVVDVQRFDRNKRHGQISICLEDGDETKNDFTIKQISNFICKPLTNGKWKFRKAPQRGARVSEAEAENKPIVRYTKDGKINYPKDHPNPKTAGKPIQGRCYICKRYHDNGKTTQWKCRRCGMPLCQIDRTKEKGSIREMSCIEEHLCSKNEYLGCGFMERAQFVMPPELKVIKETRSVAAKKAAAAQKRQEKRKQPTECVTPSPQPRGKRSRGS